MMRESELFEGNRFARGIKKIHDRLLAIARLYDQLSPAHVTLAVGWRQTLLLSLDLSRLRRASLIPLSHFWGPATIEWPTFTTKQYNQTAKDDTACSSVFGARLTASARGSGAFVRPSCASPRGADFLDMGSGTNAT
jgi:hypothetical protein